MRTEHDMQFSLNKPSFQCDVLVIFVLPLIIGIRAKWRLMLFYEILSIKSKIIWSLQFSPCINKGCMYVCMCASLAHLQPAGAPLSLSLLVFHFHVSVRCPTSISCSIIVTWPAILRLDMIGIFDILPILVKTHKVSKTEGMSTYS